MGSWQPFAKGNTLGSGRPKKTEEMRRAEELMRSRSEDGARELIALSESSEDDNVRARLLIFRWEAVFGKAPHAITGVDGGPVEIVTMAAERIAGMSDDEFDAFDRQYRQALGEGDGVGTAAPGDGGTTGDPPSGSVPP